MDLFLKIKDAVTVIWSTYKIDLHPDLMPYITNELEMAMNTNIIFKEILNFWKTKGKGNFCCLELGKGLLRHKRAQTTKENLVNWTPSKGKPFLFKRHY